MKTISLEVQDRTAEAIMRMDKEDLDNLSRKMEDWVELIEELSVNIKALQDEAKRKGLTPDILADILEMKEGEKENIFGRNE
jgi:hypothetical protein